MKCANHQMRSTLSRKMMQQCTRIFQDSCKIRVCLCVSVLFVQQKKKQTLILSHLKHTINTISGAFLVSNHHRCYYCGCWCCCCCQCHRRRCCWSSIQFHCCGFFFSSFTIIIRAHYVHMMNAKFLLHNAKERQRSIVVGSSKRMKNLYIICFWVVEPRARASSLKT